MSDTPEAADNTNREDLFGTSLSLLWQNRNFMFLWVGQGVSYLGDHFYFVALSWVILDLTGSTATLGTFLMLSSIPRLAFMVFGGVFTDRFTPRLVMILSDASRAVLVAFLGVLVLARQLTLWHLFVLAVVFGVVDAFFFPASRSIIPRLVDRARLQAANGLLQMLNQGAFFVGPAMAGAVVARAGSGPAFLIDALTFCISAVTLLAIVERSAAGKTVASTRPNVPPGLLAEAKEGLAYAWQKPLLRILILLTAFLNLGLTGPTMVGLPQLARGPLEAGAQGFGLLMSAYGLGALIGSLGMGAMGTIPHRGLTSMALLLAVGLFLMALSFTEVLITAMALLFLLGVSFAAANVMLITLLQSSADVQLLGRVMSLATLGAMGLLPVSYGLAGVVGDVLGVRALLALGGTIIGISALAGILTPTVRSVE